MSASPPATADERVSTDADTDTAAGTAAAGPARRWRPGATTGVVAAAPSAAAAMGSALIAACGSCVGLGSAAAAGATTGAAAEGGLPWWQIAFAVLVFVVLTAVQLRRALAASRTQCDAGGRTRFVLRQMAPSLLAGAVAFAAVQLLVIPWLTGPPGPPVPAGPTLP